MLFEEQISRKPDLYPWTKQFIEAIWKGFWTPEEFNFRSDYSHVFEENLNVDVIKGRVDYLRKYNKKVYADDKKQYIYSIMLFTLFVENVSLFSQFYIIMHMNRNKAVMKDCAQQVQYTRNEEMLHAQVGIKLINTLREEYPDLFDDELEARVREIIHCKKNGRIFRSDWI